MKGLYVRAAKLMIESPSSVISAAVFSRGRLQLLPFSIRAASAGTHGADPMAPATSASHSSGVMYHPTVYGVGDEVVRPAMALRNAIAPGSVSARKKTQPMM